MDPLSAISLAASVLEFIDFGLKVSKRLSEYTSSDFDHFPKALQVITTQLPLLLNSLERVQDSVKGDKFDLNTRCILKGVVAGCMGQIEQVDTILNGVMSHEGDSIAKKARKAFKSLNAEEKVSGVEKNLQTYISVLILHHVIDDKVAIVEEPTTAGIFEVPVEKAPSYRHRSDLIDRIDKYFWEVKTSQTDTPRSISLAGGSGTGKTQLAVGYCHRANESGQFKIILWVDASSPQSLSLSLQSAANLVRKSRVGSASDKIDFLKGYLADRWHPWLVVLDNYQAKAFELDDVYHLLPRVGYGAYLFTLGSGKPPSCEDVIELPPYLTEAQQEDLDTGLFSCAESYDKDKDKRAAEALRLLKLGANPNFRDPLVWAGWSPIDRAALHDQPELVRILLSYGADPWLSSREQSNRLCAYDVGAKNPTILKMLYDYEDETNTAMDAPRYDRALEDCAEGYSNRENNECAESVEMILERRKVSLEALDKALYKSAKKGFEKTTKLLLHNKAKQLKGGSKDRLLPSAIDNPSFTPASEAIVEGHFELTKALIAECSVLGYPVSSKAITGCLAELWGSGMPQDREDAAIEISRYLLDLGVDLNDVCNDMPLHSAAGADATPIIPILLEHGAQAWIDDANGYTPLELSAERGSTGAAKILLGVDAEDPTSKQNSLTRSLLIAVNMKERDIALALLRAGVDPNISFRTNPKLTVDTVALIRSIEKDDKPMIRTLLKRGARPDVFNGDGQLPLTVAARRGQRWTVSEISGKFPDVIDMKNKDGDTPLIVAIKAGHGEVVEALLEAGADRDLENEYDDTPLELAEEKGNKDIIKLLKTCNIDKS